MLLLKDWQLALDIFIKMRTLKEGVGFLPGFTFLKEF